MTFHNRFGARFNRNSRYAQAPVGQALSEDMLRMFAPSVFAAEAHGSRSERYTYIPTIEALRGLAKEGWDPVFATQGRPRDISKREFTKHMIRLRHRDAIAVRGDRRTTFKEVVLVNSHDGTSRYVLTAGAFSFICLNGTIVGETFDQLKVGHKGNIVDQVIEGTFQVVDQFGRVEGSIDNMRSITLDRDETRLLGETALAIRFQDRASHGLPAPITIDQINAPRRSEDQAPDLWTAFQRIQENAIRGGVESRVQNPETGQFGRRTTREIAGVDQLVGVNRALWTMAERFAELKRAA
jgi:hypothetical protein